MTSPDTLADRLENALKVIPEGAFDTRTRDPVALFFREAFENMPAILAALRSTASAREVETIERCAKVAEKQLTRQQVKAMDDGVGAFLTGLGGYTLAQSEIAAAIRALAPPPSPTALA